MNERQKEEIQERKEKGKSKFLKKIVRNNFGEGKKIIINYIRKK